MGRRRRDRRKRKPRRSGQRGHAPRDDRSRGPGQDVEGRVREVVPLAQRTVASIPDALRQSSPLLGELVDAIPRHRWDYALTIAAIGTAIGLPPQALRAEDLVPILFAILHHVADWDQSAEDAVAHFSTRVDQECERGASLEHAIGIWVLSRVKGEEASPDEARVAAEIGVLVKVFASAWWGEDVEATGLIRDQASVLAYLDKIKLAAPAPSRPSGVVDRGKGNVGTPSKLEEIGSRPGRRGVRIWPAVGTGIGAALVLGLAGLRYGGLGVGFALAIVGYTAGLFLVLWLESRQAAPTKQLSRIARTIGTLPFPRGRDLLDNLRAGREAVEKLFDLCESDPDVRVVMERYGATRESLSDLFQELSASGAGQWVRGHFVAAEAIARPDTLEFLLRERDLSFVERASRMIRYFEQGGGRL